LFNPSEVAKGVMGFFMFHVILVSKLYFSRLNPYAVNRDTSKEHQMQYSDFV